MLVSAHRAQHFNRKALRILQCLPTARHYHFRLDVMSELRARGLISQVTNPVMLGKALETRQVIYAGVDPTAKYLHIGHLLPLLCLFHFQLRGHKVIPLIGGATGLIGDPSGRNTERPLSEQAQIEYNVTKLTDSLNKFFRRALEYASERLPPSKKYIFAATILNNIDWFKNLGMLEFLRTVGTASRINTMIARDSVQTRLNSEQGISFTEFTYQLLQAYDFYYLRKNVSCSVQVGGSDQWGNILAGVELIKKSNPRPPSGRETEEVFGITTPLLTTPSGEKFGKSIGNALAVALDDGVTSVLDFYQFFLRTADSDVERYLKMFTLVPLQEIEEIITKHREEPEKRRAQRVLAIEVTSLIHGESGVRRAQAASDVLFGKNFSAVKAEEVLIAMRGDPRLHFFNGEEVFGTSLCQLATSLELTESNTASRKLIASGGLYVNNRRIEAPHDKLQKRDLIDGKLVILRAGAKNRTILAID